MTESVNANKA